MKKNISDLIKDCQMSMEDDSTGVTSKEIEYVYYAKLTDSSVLDKATAVEYQEQWHIKVPKTDKNAAEGRLRVRKTTKDNTVQYVMTMKTQSQTLGAVNTKNNTNILTASQSMREVSLEASEDAFDMFKLISDNGMIKTRYSLPVEGSELVFEVDRFVLPSGEYSNWVKVDLEVKGQLNELPKLPDGFSDVIYNQKDRQTNEENKLIWKLYEEVFLTKNRSVV